MRRNTSEVEGAEAADDGGKTATGAFCARARPGTAVTQKPSKSHGNRDAE
jgi:hypothetical protein